MPATLLLLATLAAPAATPPENWPAFRGPRGDGHADAADLPVHWGESDNVKWKTPVHGKAWSSPVVWGERVWLSTATEDGKELSALALDRRTGRVLLDVKVFDVAKPAFCIAYNSYASPTPCVEEGRVYVHYGSAGTACLDAATGKTLWSRRDLPCDHWRGPGSSPLLYRGLLFLTFDGYDHQYVVALDTRTGRTAWKKDRDTDYGTDNGDLKKAYATPAVVEVGGKPQLISPSAGAAIAYDPFTGAEIWRVRSGGMNVAAPPLAGPGRVFLCTGDGGWKLFAMRPDGHGDVSNSHVDWKFNKSVPSRTSPLLVGDLLYTVSEQGLVNCLEARSGTLLWQVRLKGKFCASPLYAGGRIYFFSEDGEGYVAEAGQHWKVLAANRLEEGCMASPAVAGRSLFVRTRHHLYCIEGKD
jgi:outer membrane protein assembly factor BamB